MTKNEPHRIDILQPHGILDAEQGKKLHRQVLDLLDEENQIILIDCHHLEFVDSSGLGLLVRILKAVEQAEGRLALCSINPDFQMLLKMTKMEDIFVIYASQIHFKLMTQKSFSGN